MTRLSVFAIALLFATGCRLTIPADRLPGPTPAGNAELMNYIAELPYLTADPGYRAAYLLWQNEPYEGEFADLAATLEQNEIVDDWEVGPNDALSRDKIGYMVCRALDIKRGINWSVTGWGRYAWRDLAYLGIASRVSEIGFLTGGEFLGMMSRASDYVANRYASQSQRVDLGPRPTD